MASKVWVKVVGFSAIERHSINTLFRLSVRQTPSYRLWTPECPAPPQVYLMDTDCHEAEVELNSPTFNPNLKILCVGARADSRAWRSFQRPVDWNALVQVLDDLFAKHDFGVDSSGFDTLQAKTEPAGVRVTLLVGLTRDERMYLRARLALAGLGDVDEADTAEQASLCVMHRHYDLIFVSLELCDVDPWALVQTFTGMLTAPHAVIVVTENPSWPAMEQAERMGCTGLLEIPFNPPQVLALLQKV